MPSPWDLLECEDVVTLRVFRLRRQRCLSPRTGVAHDFYVLDGNDWCNVVPLTEDGEVVMIRQFRHGTREVTLEIPGGIVDPTDPSPLAAARRELTEETGYVADTVEPLGVIRPNPAIQSNACHSFVARGARPAGALALDAAEDIEVVRVPLGEIAGCIARGEISHSLVVVAFTFLFGLGAP